MPYTPVAGDEIRFTNATSFQQELAYRVEAVDSAYVNVSVEDAITPSGERFYYDLTHDEFRRLEPVPFVTSADASADYAAPDAG